MDKKCISKIRTIVMDAAQEANQSRADTLIDSGTAENDPPEGYAGFQCVKESNSKIRFELDLKHTIKYISPEIKAILGYDPQVVIGKNFCNFIILSDLPNADSSIESVISDGKIEQVKVRVKSKDRNIMTLKVKLLPKVAKQKVTGVQGVCHTFIVPDK